MINDYWPHYQKIFRAEFDFIREKYKHTLNKGSCNEIIIKKYLSELLPDNIRIGHGEIIDSYDKRSRQTDLVIVDTTSQPFIKDYDIPNMFIVEAVTCAGEVKATLNDDSLKDSLKKCTAFKELSHKYSYGDLRFEDPNNFSDVSRFYDKKPFFIFAFESSITINTVLNKLNEYYKNTPINEQIDAIFLLDQGAIINFGDGEGALQWRYSKMGPSERGFINICGESKIIENFTSWIFTVMPKIIGFKNPIINYFSLVRK